MRSLIHVKPKSKDGKDYIRKHGELWRLTNTIERVIFCDKLGPWLHLESIKNPHYGKWVHKYDDIDFVVIEKIECKNG